MPHTITITRPGPTPNAPGFSTPVVLSGTIPVSYTLKHPSSQRVPFVQLQYSLDGGGAWQPAIAATGAITRNLSTSPEGVAHTFLWDTSTVYGQSDNVVLRIIASPYGVSPDSIAGSYPFAAPSATTFPFRVRGTLPRVVSAEQPGGVAESLVYHLPAGQLAGAERLRYPNGVIAATSPQGYLASREPLRPGDRLVALQPITHTATYTLYHTSARPVDTGLDMHVVQGGGTQTLTISPENPLMLLNLNISLEWDARNDTQFLDQLQRDLRRASDLLYDWTNGQVALGDLAIYHDQGRWNDAHIRIFATNRLRPNAVKGGIVEDARLDPDEPTPDAPSRERYEPVYLSSE